MTPTPANDLVPHERPMLIVDDVHSFDGVDGVITATVRADNPFVADGRLEPVAFAEMIAQAFAACRGFHDKQAGLPPKRGFLVVIRESDFLGTAKVGDELTIRIHKDMEVPPFAMISGEVLRGDACLATASMRVVTED